MARFVVDIDSEEFDPLADKTATVIDVLENKGGFKIATVYGIMEDNRCQFDDPSGAVDRMINAFRILHDAVLDPPPSAGGKKKFRPKSAKELEETFDMPLKAKAKPKKRRGRPRKKKSEVIEVDAEVVS